MKTTMLFGFVGWILLGAGLAAPAADEAGYLGVQIAPVPEVLSAHVKGSAGAIINEVVPGSPAEKAGLKRFDLISTLNGAPVKSPEELSGRIREAKPGETVKLGVIRGSESLTVEAALGTLPAELPEAMPREPQKPPEVVQRGFLGIGPTDVPEILSHHLGIDEGAGVLVGDVLKDSPAEKAGIQARDVLVALDGKKILGVQEFLSALSGRKAGETLKIDLIHKGEKKTVEAVLAPRPKDLPDELWPLGPWMGRQPWERDVPWGTFHRDRIIFRSPDGSEHVFKLPEALWKTDDVFKDIEKKLEMFQKQQIPELKKNLRNTLKSLEEKLKDQGAPEIRSSTSESHSAVIQTVEGGLDITLRDQNGIRTVTVLKDGKPLAKDLPYDKIDTLPPEVRDKVKGMAENIHIQIRSSPPAGGGGLEKLDLPKIKA